MRIFFYNTKAIITAFIIHYSQHSHGRCLIFTPSLQLLKKKTIQHATVHLE